MGLSSTLLPSVLPRSAGSDSLAADPGPAAAGALAAGAGACPAGAGFTASVIVTTGSVSLLQHDRRHPCAARHVGLQEARDVVRVLEY